ncbi:uncharacterized protein LOC110643583 [Hevea brasiliensis]|uniref:uncharacterized protein LOC110643583 n=1 Tax=Hevea brasiliensis TaxID=3981 RepID=UPI000B79480D|nr:uncharacterized protein LOC110643583 [Hevea brasiliensis]
MEKVPLTLGNIMPSKIRNAIGKETTGSQDTDGSPTAVGLNPQVSLMVERFEKEPAIHKEEVQNPNVLETIHTLTHAQTRSQVVQFLLLMKEIVSTIAVVLEKGIGRRMNIALEKINANTERIILLIQSLAEKFNFLILLPFDSQV